MGRRPDLNDATPDDVIYFLLSKDDRGITKIHTASCPLLSFSNPQRLHACLCPKRAAASALRKTRSHLKMAFESNGLTMAWNPQTLTGNPCSAPQVIALISDVKKEQFKAGVKPVQAPLFDQTVYQALMRIVLSSWSRASSNGDHLRAANAIQDALFYSIMWHTGLRAADTFELRYQQIRPVGDSWKIPLTLTKTAKEHSRAHTVVVRNDHGPFNPIQIFPAYVAAADRLALSASHGDIFRSIIPQEEGSASWGHLLSYAPMAARLQKWADSLNLPDAIMLHGFHGSHAAHRLEQGDSISTICLEMPWTLGTFHHYVTGREVMSMAHALALPPSNKSRDGERSA